MTDLRTAAQQALEALEQSETTVPYDGFGMAHREAERKHQTAITALRAALAEPDYWEEEARRYAGNADYWRKRYETLAEPVQEPVAWMHHLIDDITVTHRPADIDRHPDRWTALYREPKPCPTCEALAAAVERGE